MVTAALLLLLVAGADEAEAGSALVAGAAGVLAAADPAAVWLGMSHAASSAAVLSRTAAAMRDGTAPAVGLMSARSLSGTGCDRPG
jgi:hypothetical protein